MIRNVLVLGAGSAGLMMALALKRKMPQLNVRIVRSGEMGVIGVGESTTPQLVKFFFEYLGLSRKQFYAIVNPTWKIGIHFLWGPRPSFEYAFDPQLDAQWNDLPRPNGYYCDAEFDSVNLNNALMSQGKAFLAQTDGGGPDVSNFGAFHLYNPHLTKALEQFAREIGIEVIDAKITGATLGEQGVQSVVLEDGRQLEADLYVDATGFRSELLGKTLETPFVPYDRSLYCDRAVVGSWDRGADDIILPYTVAETMDAGWCWQIDHEHSVNRGYVYSSRFMTDDQARDEFLRKNPRAQTWDRPLKFRSGRYQAGWVKNVFGIGNACGFVEPLEATSLMVASSQIQAIVTMLTHAQLDPNDTMRALYNKHFVDWWDGIRDFLAIHYRFNTRLQTDFWRTCCNEADVEPSRELLEFYAENGPTGLGRYLLKSTIGNQNQFGIEGFLTLLVGQKVPYKVKHPPSEQEREIFRRHCAANRALVTQRGMTVAEALKYVKHPQWQWASDRAAYGMTG